MPELPKHPQPAKWMMVYWGDLQVDPLDVNHMCFGEQEEDTMRRYVEKYRFRGYTVQVYECQPIDVNTDPV